MSLPRLGTWLLTGALALASAASAIAADGFRTYEGHGGPVMAVALSADGQSLLTASFDYSLGLWRGESAAPRWLEGHRAAVNAVVFLGPGRAASAGDDFAILIWDLATGTAIGRLEGHRGRIVALAPSPDGSRLASASWDGTIRLWDLATGAAEKLLSGQRGGVNDLAWRADGTRLLSAGSDGTILEWDTGTGRLSRALVRHGFGVNRLALDEARGWLAYGAVDGGTRVIDLATGETLADLTLDRRPILALARSPDGTRLAIGDGHGYIMVVNTARWSIERDFRAAVNGPIWALAFSADGSSVIAGGLDNTAYRWPLDAGSGGGGGLPRMAGAERGFHAGSDGLSNGERQFLRTCAICHSLDAEGGRRAGPPLGGLFGRPAGSVPGYNYSPALSASGIVWAEDTIDRLFDLGPEILTPGSKMPMQRIAAPQDRADLIAFLKRGTAPAAEP